MLRIGLLEGYKKGLRPSFKSKVVFENSKIPLTAEQKNYIDMFEEGETYDARFLGEGVTSRAYYSSKQNFVIKQHKDNPYIKTLARDDKGSLNYENKILQAIAPNVKTTQRSIGYVETENGNQFLLSTFVPGKPANIKTNPFMDKHFDRLLRNLERLDRSHIIHSDLSRPNLLLNSNFDVNIIDYQWAEKFEPSLQKQGYGLGNAFFPSFEMPNNFAMFESAALPGYMRTTTPEGAEDILRRYLSLKTHYIEKKHANLMEYFSEQKRLDRSAAEFELAKLKAYKALDDHILTAELLKINILNMHRRQYTFYDKNKIEPRNILKAIPLMLEAKKCATELTLIEPKYSCDAPYFKFMNAYGKFWQEKMLHWYPDAISWFFRLVTGVQRAEGKILFPEKYDDFSGLDKVEIPCDINNSFFKRLKKFFNQPFTRTSIILLEIFKMGREEAHGYINCRDTIDKITRDIFKVIVKER